MVLKRHWNDGHPYLERDPGGLIQEVGRVRTLHHDDRLTSHDGEVTACQLVELIERMITVDRTLTREQLDQLTEQLLPADFPGSAAG
jgi:hypothetical protein